MHNATIDAERLALYKSGGFEDACILCFGVFEPSTLAGTPLAIPPSYSRDLATIVAAFIDDGGNGKVCRVCEPILATGDLNPIAAAGVRRLRESPWYHGLGEAEQFAVVGMWTLVQYAWWQTNHPAVAGEPAPALRFTVELFRTYPLRPPVNQPAVGPLEVFTRDVGMGCYVTVCPQGDVVVFTDFASKEKRKGYGGASFRKLLALADRCGVAVAGVVEAHGKHGGRANALTNHELLRWYEKLGFQRLGKQNGQWLIRREPRI